MTLGKSFIIQKLTELSNYLKEIEILFKSSDREILKDNYKLRTAERLLQLSVDLILDINQHFIREVKLKSSEDFQSTFYILADNKILPKRFADKIAPVVGLRNRIVHRYDSLDKKLFIKTFRKNYPDFKIYIKEINKFLQSK